MVKRVGNSDAQALFERSQQYFVNGDIEAMVSHLEQAASTGLAAAQDALGYVYDKGFGADKDLQRARALYRQEAEQDHAQAQYRLAESCFIGDGAAYDANEALSWYLRSARSGFPAACRTLGLLYGQAHSAEYARHAVYWFHQGAKNHDPGCEFALGWRLQHGIDLPRDSQIAQRYFKRAMQAGYPCAKSALMATLHSKFSVTTQLDMNALCKKPQIDTPKLPDPASIVQQWERLHDSPRIERCTGLLNAETASHVIYSAMPRLTPSEVIDTEQDGGKARSQVRTSSSAFFPENLIDAVIRNIERRLCIHVNKPLCESEPCNLLQYLPGQQYRPHFDYFDPSLPTAPALLKCGGQRTISVVMNLCEVAGGGETNFPELGLSIPARQGDAVLFHNCDAQGQPDPSSLHAGLPVTNGEKVVLVKWYRERSTRYSAV